jgi:hypothetical protein
MAGHLNHVGVFHGLNEFLGGKKAKRRVPGAIKGGGGKGQGAISLLKRVTSGLGQAIATKK